MGLLRGYGNAIVPEVAEVFVRAWMECSANAPREGRAVARTLDADVGGKDQA